MVDSNRFQSTLKSKNLTVNLRTCNSEDQDRYCAKHRHGAAQIVETEQETEQDKAMPVRSFKLQDQQDGQLSNELA